MDLAQETDLRWQIPMLEQLDAAKRKLHAFSAEAFACGDSHILFYVDEKSDFHRCASSHPLYTQPYILRYRGGISV